MMKYTPRIALSFALSAALMACDSKFVEKSPDAVTLDGITLEERMNQKVEIDARIDSLEEGANKIKRILDLFREVQNPDGRFDVYTPIDFVIDLNAELKEKIPVARKDGLVRRGEVIIPVEALSEDCRKVEGLLQSSVVFKNPDLKKTPIGERLTYSFKTCGSEGEFVTAFEAIWIGSMLELQLKRENLQAIFNDILVADSSLNASCQIDQDKNGIIASMHCENLELRLSTSELALMTRISFDNQAVIRFFAEADIFEHGRKKSESVIRVMDNGDIDFDLRKIGSEDESGEKQTDTSPKEMPAQQQDKDNPPQDEN